MSTLAEPAPSAADVVRIAARAHERDRYLAALLSPRAVRPDLIALAAFAGEIGRIPLYVHEPMMIRIRLQWWRERIEQRNSGGHPVAAAIIATLTRHDLPVPKLTGLIDAHEDGLDDQPFAADADLIAHLDLIDGSLFDLAARICGIAAPSTLSTDAGRAYGIARIGLETPAALAHGRLLLPGRSARPFDRAEIALRLRRVAVLARRHLAACSAAVAGLSREARSPFLPLALVEPYLQALEQREFHPDSTMDVNPLQRVWRLWRYRWTGPDRSRAGN